MVMHVVGARPQFIKLAPVLKAFGEHGIPSKVIHTGQHYDYQMSGLLFENLGLAAPEFYLGIGSGTHGAQTAGMLSAIESILMQEKPALVLVYGDTNSTLAGALAAVKLHIPTGHVEAGLRSFDKHMPEEINRITADHLADYRFCPTPHALELLAAEGLDGIVTGDVMVDALRLYAGMDQPSPYEKPYALVTIHRAENTDDPARFHAIWQALHLIAPEMSVIFPVHPRTRARYPEFFQTEIPGMQFTEPLGYVDMITAMRHAACILTDSGGVQKEAFLLGRPCVTVRKTTEWLETVHAGANRLVAAVPGLIAEAVHEMRRHTLPVPDKHTFGDGQASYRIAQFIKEHIYGY